VNHFTMQIVYFTLLLLDKRPNSFNVIFEHIMLPNQFAPTEKEKLSASWLFDLYI